MMTAAQMRAGRIVLVVLAACLWRPAWGGQRLEWNVYQPNKLAFDFYRRLGGEVIEGLVVMSLRSDAV